MNVVMVVKSGITDDARIRRIAAAVVELGHDVTVIGDRPGPDDPIPGVDMRFARGVRGRSSVGFTDPMRRAARWLLLPTHRRRDDVAFASAVRALEAVPDADVIHAHDLSGLRAAQPLVSTDSRLIYDAHECWTRQGLAGRPTPMLDWRDRRAEGHLGAEADCVITVSEPLGRWLQDTYGWAVVNIVRNTFPAFPTSPKDVQPYALLYAGRVDKERDLDTVINGAARHGELKVVIRGNGDAATIRRIEAGGVIVEPARPVDELVADYRRCGIGVVSLTGDSFNHDVALPNKLFHAVQAGVPIIASDLPAIRSVVEEHGIGECYSSGDPDSFAAAITRLLSSYDEKLAAVANAKEALSWAHDKRILVDLYREINR